MKKTFLVFLLALLAFPVPCQAGDGQLYLYIWSEYIPDSVLDDFTRETGIEVHVSTYDSNEAMYAKVKMTGQGYDLIVPSSDYVGLMRREGLLLPLDHSLLPNLANLNPRFLDQGFDPANTYSVPYMWGSTAIAVNTNMVDGQTVTSIEDLWKPEVSGQLLLPNDQREVLGLGLLRLGYSLNDTDPTHLDEAYSLIATLMPGVRVFDSDSPKQALLSGEAPVAVLWNGEAYIANAEDPAIVYIYPPEGFSLWMDNFCIPAGAGNIDEAHAFLNYIMRPEVSATISEEMGYSTPNSAAMDLMSEETRSNPIVYPDDATLERGEFLDDIGDAVILYNDYWVRLKTGQDQ